MNVSKLSCMLYANASLLWLTLDKSWQKKQCNLIIINPLPRNRYFADLGIKGNKCLNNYFLNLQNLDQFSAGNLKYSHLSKRKSLKICEVNGLWTTKDDPIQRENWEFDLRFKVSFKQTRYVLNLNTWQEFLFLQCFSSNCSFQM